MIRHLEETNIAIGVLGVHFSVIDEKLYPEHLAFQASRDLEQRTRSFLGLCITGQDGDGAYYENQLALRLDFGKLSITKHCFICLDYILSIPFSLSWLSLLPP